MNLQYIDRLEEQPDVLADDSIRAMVFTVRGLTFSAGMNLKQLQRE